MGIMELARFWFAQTHQGRVPEDEELFAALQLACGGSAVTTRDELVDYWAQSVVSPAVRTAWQVQRKMTGKSPSAGGPGRGQQPAHPPQHYGGAHSSAAGGEQPHLVAQHQPRQLAGQQLQPLRPAGAQQPHAEAQQHAEEQQRQQQQEEPAQQPQQQTRTKATLTADEPVPMSAGGPRVLPTTSGGPGLPTTQQQTFRMFRRPVR